MLITAVSDSVLWLGLATIVVKSVTNKVRAAIIAKSLAAVWVLLTTAVSETTLWLLWVTIAVKSVVNIERLAMVAKSATRV